MALLPSCAQLHLRIPDQSNPCCKCAISATVARSRLPLGWEGGLHKGLSFADKPL